MRGPFRASTEIASYNRAGDTMAEYRLICQHPDCGEVYETDPEYRLVCDRQADGTHGPALLRAAYDRRRIDVQTQLPGIFRYSDWLPTGKWHLDPPGPPLGAPICFRSHGLAQRLGLSNLHISFAGYWPERGADVITRSFKEFEVQASITRYLASAADQAPRPLVVSSAGNTANAYNLLAHQLDMPIYLVLPEAGLDKMICPLETKPFLAVVRGDYLDAIKLADAVQARTGLSRDGGVANVGRRAGMGTVMVQAVADPDCGTGTMFDHYFQAVGSAAGAISAWEAVELLLADGRFGKTATRIHMAQNEPFTPIPDSWERRTRELVMAEDSVARARIAAATAQVLTNRHPPYAVAGGIYDVLERSDGMAWRVNNYDLFQAARMFKQSEGVDIGEASAVAVSSLQQAVARGAVQPRDRVLLHITGGGLELQYSASKEYRNEATIVVEPGDVETLVEAIGNVEPIRDHSERLQPLPESGRPTSPIRRRGPRPYSVPRIVTKAAGH
jgi:cysteate synthase